MPAQRSLGKEQKKKNRHWQKIVKYFSIFAELSNAGIFIEVIGKWLPRFAALVAATPLGYLIYIGDPLIYFFRSLIRLTQLVGRNFFNIQFEEDQFQSKWQPTDKWQTARDLLSLSCFILAIALFCGALIASPLGITLAWTVGLMGLGINGYSDYYRPERGAYNKYRTVLAGPDEPALNKKVDTAYGDYARLKKSRQLFVCLLVGLSLLLICGSLATFAPPLLVPVLAVISKSASLFLAALGCTRLYNWCTSPKKQDTEASSAISPPIPVNEIEMMPLPTRYQPQPRPAAMATAPQKNSKPSSQGGFFDQNWRNFISCGQEYTNKEPILQNSSLSKCDI